MLADSLCFTDSEIVLHWIYGQDRTWKPFVQNRVQEIRQAVPMKSWKHCGGWETPADLPSRGLTLQELTVSSLWLQGPSWLGELEPVGELGDVLPTECLVELQAKDRLTVLLTTAGIGVSNIVEISRYGNRDKLLRVTQLVVKFVRGLQ